MMSATTQPTNPEVIEELRRLQQEVADSRAEIARLEGGGGERTVGARGEFIVHTVPAYVHCADPFCRGMETQREVTAQLEVWIQSYGSRGGSDEYVDRIENTSERLFFANIDDYVCPDCGKPSLEISRQRRPEYKRLSGHDPDRLLKQIRSGITSKSVVDEAMNKRAEGGGDEIRELRQQLAQQQAALAFVMGQQSGQPVTLPPELAEMIGAVPPDPEPEPESAGLPTGVVQTRGGRFKALYRDENGKQRSATRDTVDEAAALREQRIAEVAAKKAGE